MHRSLIVMTITALVSVFGVAPAWAACAPPSIEIEPSAGSPGDSITVHGIGFGTTCDDVGTPEDPPGGLGPPDEEIPIRMVMGERSWLLTTVAADENYEFSVSVTVPTDVRSGSATVEAEGEGSTAEASFEVMTETLPETGTAPQAWAVAAAAMLALGALLVRSRRSGRA